jgi:hypothetical protein
MQRTTTESIRGPTLNGRPETMRTSVQYLPLGSVSKGTFVFSNEGGMTL